MAYGYYRPDPDEMFRGFVKRQLKMMEIAVEEGCSEEQAMELLKTYVLYEIASNTSQIGN